ncbi:MAG TPA: hypothetical protein VG733_04170 [Chthoniobacteraceae bacterium]|nr:hypothetical protein [Chthoniobacteraceae bacterium]
MNATKTTRLLSIARPGRVVCAALCWFLSAGWCGAQMQRGWRDRDVDKDAIGVATGMLLQAVQVMDAAVWRVEVRIQQKEIVVRTGEESDWRPAGSASGLISGGDFDFTGKGDPIGNIHRIGINVNMWTTGDNGKTWEIGTRNPNIPEFWVVGLPLRGWTAHTMFEPMGREEHEDGFWLHVRSWHSEQPIDCWFSMNEKGEPACVRRVEAQFTDPTVRAMRKRSFLYTVEITPAKQGEKIAAPGVK